MRHVLITGGAGFIGSHLCEKFLGAGYAVTALDNLVTGQVSNLDGILHGSQSGSFSFVERDVSLPFAEKDIPLIGRYGLHGVLHFACPASPVDFDRIPFEILAVDSIGTFHVMELALKHRSRFVLASTSEVYGDPEVHPQKETYWGNVNTLGVRACYDETKRFAEAAVSTAMRGVGKFGGKNYEPLNAGIVRIFNTYGPRMRPDDGRVVPEFCINALNGKPLVLHGGGQQTRSFCFVTDLVDGIFKLFESSARDVFNIGNPVERTIREFAEGVVSLSNSVSKIVEGEARSDDPKRRCPNISKAQEVLGWNPRVDLKDGLKQTLEYFRSRL